MSTPAATPDRPLRKDAERNRQRILEAAREVFAEHGLSASLDAIAAHAGVGVGTVYRRFPDKAELIAALFEEGVEKVVAVAHEGLAIEDPWDGLVHFLIGAQELQASDRGLRELMLASQGELRCSGSARERIAPVAGQLLLRAQAAGVVRADLAISDLPLTQFAIGAMRDHTRDEAPELWRRLMTIVLDGLRPSRDTTTPFPEPPLAPEALDRVLRGCPTAGPGRRG
jgi:AcrR family transcriptional regulator